MSAGKRRATMATDGLAAIDDYRLNEQIGFLLRLATQRHTGIFTATMMRELTPTRFAALAKLYETGPVSQNELGRRTAMDAATIKGVVDRLKELGLVTTVADPNDARRHIVTLTASGDEAVRAAIPLAQRITEKTLAPLAEAERSLLLRLIGKLT